jgi:hypothetical protein
MSCRGGSRAGPLSPAKEGSSRSRNVAPSKTAAGWHAELQPRLQHLSGGKPAVKKGATKIADQKVQPRLPINRCDQDRRSQRCGPASPITGCRRDPRFDGGTLRSGARDGRFGKQLRARDDAVLTHRQSHDAVLDLTPHRSSLSKGHDHNPPVGHQPSHGHTTTVPPIDHQPSHGHDHNPPIIVGALYAIRIRSA